MKQMHYEWLSGLWQGQCSYLCNYVHSASILTQTHTKNTPLLNAYTIKHIPVKVHVH